MPRNPYTLPVVQLERGELLRLSLAQNTKVSIDQNVVKHDKPIKWNDF